MELNIIKHTQMKSKVFQAAVEDLAYGICALHANNKAVHQARLLVLDPIRTGKRKGVVNGFCRSARGPTL